MRTRWRWWLQGVVFALLTAAALCVVWADRQDWRIRLGIDIDIQGGLRLG